MNRPLNSLKAVLLGIPLVFLSAASASAVLIEFTTAEGYTTGVLNQQPNGSGNWSTTSTSSYFQVNTDNGGSVSLATNVNNPIAGYFSPVSFTSGTTLTTFMDFQFNQFTAVIAPASATSAFGLTYATTQTSGASNSANAFLGRQVGTDAYRLIAMGSTTNVTGLALGINSTASDTLSDTIRMTLTLTYSSAASTWSGVATLINLATETTVATITKNGFSISSFSPDSLYGAMQIGSQMSTSGLSSVSVLNYSTPVPEPGTVVLASMGLGAILIFRRRRALASR